MAERDVGTAFVHKYYSTFSKNPVELGSMYSKGSLFAHASVGRSLDFVEGREDITATLEEIARGDGNQDCKFTLHNVDCVPSLGGSIMLLVQGMMLTRETTREFAHTFLLGRNTDNTFYIHNDVMRICEHDDEDEEDYEAEEEEEEEVAATIPTVEEVTGEVFDEPKPAAAKPPAPTPKKAAPKEEEPEPVVKIEKTKARPSSWAAMVSATSSLQGETKKAVRVTGGATVVQQAAKKKVVKSDEPRKGGKGGDRPRKDKGDKGDVVRKEKRPDINYNYHSLYLSKLPEGFKEADVKNVFGKFGTIKGMKYQDGQTMNAGGRRCFVDYDSKEAVEAALKDQIKWNGVVLNVQERKSPMQRKQEEKGGKDAPRRNEKRN
eukprot:TRINITY_DN6969_c0_g1_i2.p1 TRINITY_DN6969_c0_g1~~TRINITY_DN6969_c0_g1_i2.p1  ORF type:complete len:393 (+),score=141.45 TRINITY_DN6969_c0_g1_i2:49-1179(+)